MHRGFMKDLKTFITASRPQFFPAIAIPIFLGVAVAYGEGRRIGVLYLLLTLLAGIAYHGGMNLINDYFDHLRGTDDMDPDPLTPYAGGSRVIQKGLVPPERVFRWGMSLLTTGTIIGLFIALNGRLWLIPIGLFGLFTGFFYSAPPLFLSGKGLGEVLVALDFGILPVIGSYYIQTGAFSMDALFASLPLSILVASILFVNQFPDCEVDRKTGKMNLVARFGRERMRYGLFALLALTLFLILGGIKEGGIPFLGLLCLMPSIYGFRAAYGLYREYDRKRELLTHMRAVIRVYTVTGILLIGVYLLEGI